MKSKPDADADADAETETDDCWLIASEILQKSSDLDDLDRIRSEMEVMKINEDLMQSASGWGSSSRENRERDPKLSRRTNGWEPWEETGGELI